MKRRFIILIFLMMVLLGCARIQEKDSISRPETDNFFWVETAIEYHSDVVGERRMDIRFPRVSSDVPGAEILNDMLKTDFPLHREDEFDNWSTAEGYKYTWYREDYSFSDIDGICSLTIHSTFSSAYGSYAPNRWVSSYYFNRNTGTILNRHEYITAIGYTQRDIIEAYIAECCPAYSPEMIDFENILFYVDENRELQFIFSFLAFKTGLIGEWPQS